MMIILQIQILMGVEHTYILISRLKWNIYLKPKTNKNKNNLSKTNKQKQNKKVTSRVKILGIK